MYSTQTHTQTHTKTHTKTHNQTQTKVPMFRSSHVPIKMAMFLCRFARSPYLAEPCYSRSRAYYVFLFQRYRALLICLDCKTTGCSIIFIFRTWWPWALLKILFSLITVFSVNFKLRNFEPPPPKLEHLLTAPPQMAANIRIYRSRPNHAKCRL